MSLLEQIFGSHINLFSLYEGFWRRVTLSGYCDLKYFAEDLNKGTENIKNFRKNYYPDYIFCLGVACVISKISEIMDIKEFTPEKVACVSVSLQSIKKFFFTRPNPEMINISSNFCFEFTMISPSKIDSVKLFEELKTENIPNYLVFESEVENFEEISKTLLNNLPKEDFLKKYLEFDPAIIQFIRENPKQADICLKELKSEFKNYYGKQAVSVLKLGMALGTFLKIESPAELEGYASKLLGILGRGEKDPDVIVKELLSLN